MRRFRSGATIVVVGITMMTACGDGAARQEGTGAAAAPATYEQSETAAQASALTDADKTDEAIALLAPYVAANPKRADGYFILAMAHDRAAFNLKLADKKDAPDRRAHLEKAAANYAMYVSLVKDMEDRSLAPVGLKSLVELYLPDNLNQPADAENVARRLVDSDSRSAEPYLVLARVLRETGRAEEAVPILHKLRFDLPASEQRDIAAGMWVHVQQSPALSPQSIQTLVDDLHAIGDGWLANEPANPTGPNAKAYALKLQSEHLERDAKRRQSLQQEAKIWEDAADTQNRAEFAALMTKLKQLQQMRAQRQ